METRCVNSNHSVRIQNVGNAPNSVSFTLPSCAPRNANFSPNMATPSSPDMSSAPPVSSDTEECQTGATTAFINDIHNAVDVFMETLDQVARNHGWCVSVLFCYFPNLTQWLIYCSSKEYA